MSFKLKKKRVRNAADMWVRAQGAFTSIVDSALFYTARGILLERARRLSDAELLAKLRTLLETHGTLSAAVIDSADAVPSSCVYRNRFGSLLRAYELAGFRPSRDFQYLEVNQHLKTVEGKLVADVLAQFAASGASALPDKRTGLMLINGE
jgi:hypothetical protein